jgi:hypothetical protein
MKKNFSLLQAILAIGVLALPFALFFVPMNWLEGHGTICLFKNIFGIECWGCGITRAVVSVVQFEFKRAIEYNWKVVIVFPILCWIWFNYLKNCFFNFFKKGGLNG